MLSRTTLLLLIELLPACAAHRGTPAPGKPAARTPRPAARLGDPAHIEGRWHYRTRSSCSREEGVGEVMFSWNAKDRHYAELGYIYWADHRQIFRWWGVERYRPAAQVLAGNLVNSLGDSVQGQWQIAPGRLVLRWKQSNGCSGEGAATPPESLFTALRVRRATSRLGSANVTERIAAARELGEMQRAATGAIPRLLTIAQSAEGDLAQAAWDALDRIRK